MFKGRTAAPNGAVVDDRGFDAWGSGTDGTFVETIVPPASVNGTPGSDFIHVSGDGLTAPPGYNDIPGATNGNDVITSGGGGDDIVFAGLGDDRIIFSSDFTGADQVDGQGGTDTVELNGDYTATVALQAGTLANIETLQLDAGHSYSLDFTNAALTNAVTIDASTLGQFDSLTVQDSNKYAAYVPSVVGGAGDDTIIGIFSHVDLSHGGNDRFIGTQEFGGQVYMGAALTAEDSITSADVELNGDYSVGFDFGSATLKDLRSLTFDAGHSYNITLTDSDVVGYSIGIYATALGATDSLTFSAAALRNSHMYFASSAGNNDVVGTPNDDNFFFNFSGSISVQAGGGDDNIGFNPGALDPTRAHLDGGLGYDGVELDSGLSCTLDPSWIKNIEYIQLNGTSSDAYHLVLTDGILAAGSTLTIDDNSHIQQYIDGSAVTDWHLKFIGSSVGETLIGGALSDKFQLLIDPNSTDLGGGGDDTFYANAASLGSGQIIDGGAGTDTIEVSGPVSFQDIVIGNLTNVEVMHLDSLGYFSFTTTDSTVAAGQTLFVDGSSLAGGRTLKFTGSAETDGNFHLVGGSGNDTIIAGNGNDILEGRGGNDYLNGFFGNDTVSYEHAGGAVTVSLAIIGPQTIGGGQGTDTIKNIDNLIGSKFNDKLTGNDGDNDLQGMAGNDALDGGNGSDTADYALATGGVTVDLGNSGAQNVGGGAGTDTLISIENLKGSAFADVLLGNSIDNRLDGGDGDDEIDVSSGGNDTALGGAGNDVIVAGGALTSADKIDGGDGIDKVLLDGDYSAGVTLSATTLINAEILALAAGHSYKIATNNAMVAAGQSLTVDGSSLTATDSLNFNGSAEHDGAFVLMGGGGNDTLIGGAGSDTVDYAGATGGVTVSLAVTTAQNVGGGEGTDTLNSIENVEGSKFGDALTGTSGNNTIILSDGGNDTATAGAGNDVIVMGGSLTAADKIDGGVGTDKVMLDGDYSAAVTFSAATMINVETLSLAADHSYTLTTNNANVGAGQTLTVDGSQLGAADVLTFNGSAETDGKLVILGGAGNDALTSGAGDDTLSGGAGDDALVAPKGGNDTVNGGDGNDTIRMGAFLTSADRIDGGSGADQAWITGDYSHGLTFSGTTMVNVETLVLGAGYSYTLTTNNANVAAGQTLTVDGSRLGAANTLTFNGSAEADGKLVILGGAGNDTLTSGAGDDTLSGGAGNDTLTAPKGGNDTISGGDGDDTIRMGAFLTATDRIGGGYGADQAWLTGDYSHGLTFSATTMVNVETIVLGAGYSYTLTTNDATVAAGQTLTVDGSGLKAGDILVFDGSAEMNGRFAILGGAGNDVLTGGTGADHFDLTKGGNDTANGGAGDDSFVFGGALTSADHVDGGSGKDTVVLNGDYSAGLTFSATTTVNVETLQLLGTHSYALTMSDATVAAGEVLTVTAKTLTQSLTFDGSAEQDGSFVVLGGKGNDALTGGVHGDTLSGGAGNDTIMGGGGGDVLSGWSGHNSFVYDGVTDSTGPAFDTISQFNVKSDAIDLWFQVAKIDSAVSGGALTSGQFDSDLAAAIGSGQLQSDHAVLFTPDSGDYVGETFLIVDANGIAGYQAGQDLVIAFDHTAHLDHFNLTNFI